MARHGERPALWAAAIIAACSLLTPAPSHAQAPAPVVADLVRTYATTNGFSGTVLVDQGGEALVFESFGLAERAFNAPATNETRYRIASITKLFTATLILQLVDRGEVDLQAPVATYLPDYRGDPRITVHTLLNHTSGLPNPDAGADPTKGVPLYQLPHTPEELVRDYASGAVVHDPGTKWDYNNADYFVQGRIIETVTGQSYAEVLQQRVLDPLGLKDTGMLRHSDIVPRLAASYFRMGDDQPLGTDLPVYPENWFAAGAMYSDADDLLVFSNAFQDGDLFSRDSLARALTPGLEDNGYGQFVWDLEVGGRTYHTTVRFGGIMGANAVIYRVRETDLTIIILANTNLVDMGTFARRIAVTALE